MKHHKTPTAKLSNGVEMPMVGMGTWPLSGAKLALLVLRARLIGYRAFDTAAAYGNDGSLGKGIRICGLPRSKLFITSKLSNHEQRDGDVREALQRSLRRARLKYLDLYLMHWPNPETFLDSWRQMVAIYQEGLVRSIGVCNFHKHHLERLFETSNVIPAVNQIELHPMLPQVELRNFCKAIGIQVTAYSPLARMHKKLILNNVLTTIAKKHLKSVPQIVLRWDYQHGLISIPRSSSPTRLRDNLNIFDFELPTDEMADIDSLEINIRVRHNPDNCDFSKL